jgi:hypothetical protein
MFVVCKSFNGDVSNSDYISSNDWMIVNKEWKKKKVKLSQEAVETHRVIRCQSSHIFQTIGS